MIKVLREYRLQSNIAREEETLKAFTLTKYIISLLCFSAVSFSMFKYNLNLDAVFAYLIR